VEDDGRLAAMLEEYLAGRGFAVTTAGTLAKAGRALKDGAFDIMILDLMLPDGDGMDFCRQARAVTSIPIVMLTARGDSADKVAGLELGADDYIQKPFDPAELAARLRAALRRAAPMAPAGAIIRLAGLEVNLDAMEISKDGKKLEITPRQFAIFRALLERAGRVVNRETLMDAIGGELEAFDRSIDVHVSRIRAAIEENPKEPKLIKTVRGSGYILTAQAEEAGGKERRDG